MGTGETEEPTGPAASTDPPESTTPEDVAAFLAARIVTGAAEATATWLHDSAAAFEASLKKAVKNEYTLNQLVNDSAQMWARNIVFVADLLAAGRRPPGPTPKPGSGSGSAPRRERPHAS